MDPDDWSVFLDPDDFAEPWAWESAGGFGEGHGIFSDAHGAAFGGEFAGVSTREPLLALSAADLPPDAAQGDAVEVRGRSWRAADLQPDGAGLVRVILERE